ncbi:MAG: glycosyltransferase [Desulfocucumaceae bacterium]
MERTVLVFIDEDWDSPPLGYTRKRMLLALWNAAKAYNIKVVLVNRPFCLLSGWFTRANMLFKAGKWLKTKEGLEIIYPFGLHEQLITIVPWLGIFAAKQIKRMIAKCQYKYIFGCMYFHPYQAYLLSMYHDVIKIYECYDDYTNMHSDLPLRELLKLEISLITNSDIVITTSEELKTDRLKYRNDIVCLPNGVDYEMYEGCEVVKEELSGMGLKIGFVGKLNSKIDFPLMNLVAEKSPEWNYYMIGPWDEKKESIPGAMESLNIRNIIYTGPIRYEELPQWVNGFDAVIIPYLCNEKTHGIFPLKYFEYLAAGKPVISTKFASYGGDNSVYLSDSEPKQFINCIEKARKDDSPQLREERKKTARKHSWVRRAEEVLSMLQDRI